MAASTHTSFCHKSTIADSDWEALYEAAFRVDQRTPLTQLQDGIRNGNMLLHRTVQDKQGLLCFSVTNVLQSVALLAYLATDTTKRSGGYGSKHMKSLITQVQTDHANLLGLFAEIESTRDKHISEDERKIRRRRLAFYQRLGFKRLKPVYTVPSYEKSVPDEEGELLWLEFSKGSIDAAKMTEIIKEIYTRAYNLKADDTRVTAVAVPAGEIVETPIDDPGHSATPADQTANATVPTADSSVADASSAQPAKADAEQPVTTKIAVSAAEATAEVQAPPVTPAAQTTVPSTSGERDGAPDGTNSASKVA